MTKFSFEVPIKHLQDFEDLQDFHFILSMLYDNPVYRDFYEQQYRKGEKTIWVDNSFNEKQTPDDLNLLVDIAQSLNAAKVISPDSLDWTQEVIGDAFLETCEKIEPERIIVVARSPEMQTYLKRIGVAHFALPYKVRPNLGMIDTMEMMPSHYLGLNDIPEILDFKPPTCDTSMPIKLAMKGIFVRDWAAKGYPHIYTYELGLHGSDYFNATLSKEQLNLARLNIIRIKEVCNEEG